MVSVKEDLIAKILQHEIRKHKEERIKKDGATKTTHCISTSLKEDEEYPLLEKSFIKKKKKKNKVDLKVAVACCRNDDTAKGTRRDGRRAERDEGEGQPPPEKRCRSQTHPLCCSVCQRQFKLVTNLRLHESLQHDDTASAAGPFPCPVCGRTFARIRLLYAHSKIHSGIRPHVCDVCGHAFLHNSDLTVHRRKHTGHRPYACHACGDSFSSAANRMMHMRTHTGHRPHVCRHCGRSFNQSHVLVEHVRLHTGHRPYECGMCGWSFVSSGGLRKHSLRKHVQRF